MEGTNALCCAQVGVDLVKVPDGENIILVGPHFSETVSNQRVDMKVKSSHCVPGEPQSLPCHSQLLFVSEICHVRTENHAT